MRYLMTFFCIIFTISVIAQDTCSAYVSDVLETLDTVCEATSRNELCYGNNIVSVTTITGESLDFSQPGDIVPIAEIDSIRTNPYAEPDEWGIALMKIQANIPDSLPGQNVTFLLYGDVNLTNASSSSVTLSANTAGNINVRSGPSTNFAVADSLQGNISVELVGRNAAADWVYFVTEDSSGWLFAPLLNIDGDVMSLDEVANDFGGSLSASPMQVVYFSSGIGEPTCNEVPQDGILIQTAEYDEPIELIINDVEISLASTVYLQAEPDHAMWVYVLEGFAIVTADGSTVIVPEGAFVWIPIDEELHATGEPVQAEGYDSNIVVDAPIIVLDEDIEIAEAVEGAIQTQTIVVDSNADWIDTGIHVAEGQSLFFGATGSINVWENCEEEILLDPSTEGIDCSSLIYGPNGGTFIIDGELLPFSPDPNFPAPDVMFHSLIGRIGGGEPFFIGSSHTMSTDSEGTLQLRLNDVDTNNSGEFVVHISVL